MDYTEQEVIPLNKQQKTLLAGLGAAACAGAGFLYLIAPGRADKAKRAPFQKRYFAHRGLHGEGVPENTLAAFRAAAAHGYGVELDARLTRDGVAVVSHDGSLERMAGRDISVDKTDYALLKTVKLGGTEETVPTLSQALDILCPAGVPVIVEVKPVPRRQRSALCAAVLSELDRREGHFCVESFDPRIVRWFRRHAPDLLRGQLTAQADHLGGAALQRYASSRVLFNFLGRPQFIAHRVGRQSLPVKLAHLLGAMRVCWVATDRTEEEKNDGVIFEDFLPPVNYP